MASAIDIKGLRKTYASSLPWARSKTVAVRDLSLAIPAQEIFGLLGPNGAGKTTTIKMIAGLVEPESGQISFPAWGRRPRIGAVLEGSRNLYWRMSAWENIRYFGELKGVSLTDLRRQADELLDLFGLAGKRDAPAQTLSRGMQQKLAVVLALLGQPELLLLDEPTLGLDVASSLAIQRLLREFCRVRGVSIVVTTHQMDVAQQLCRSVAIMRDGQIALTDTVESLVDLFRRQDYTVRLSREDFTRTLPSLAVLQGAGQIISWEELEEQREGKVSLRISLPAAQSLYALINMFEERAAVLDDFRQETPTLESIFVSVTEQAVEMPQGVGR